MINAYQIVLQALAVWREASNQPTEAQRAVIWSMNNRAARAAWWNHNTPFDLVEVIRFPDQYSSMTFRGDPNTIRYPKNKDEVFNNLLLLCMTPGDDPTNGSTHYYSTDIPEPGWAKEMEFTVTIGAFRFYKVPS